MPQNTNTRNIGDFCVYWSKLNELDKWILLGRAVYMRYRRIRIVAAGALVILAVILGVGIFKAPIVASVMLLVGFIIGLLIAWG